MKKSFLLVFLLFLFSTPALAGVVTITVSTIEDPVSPAGVATGNCDDSTLASNLITCSTLRKAIDYINDGSHCTRGTAFESLSYIINVPDGTLSLNVPNNIADRNDPNASLDFNRTGDLDISFACHTPTTGDAPYVVIQAPSRLTINASNINNAGDPDRIFDVHQGKIHFRKINITGGLLFALSSTARGIDHSDDCSESENVMGGGLLVRPNAEVIYEDGEASGNQVKCGVGGGFANLGKLAIINSSISNNFTGTGSRGSYSQPIRIGTVTPLSYERYGVANGGGIYNSGELYVVNSSITGNRSGNNGGGIFNSGSGALAFLNNVTLNENEAAGIARIKATPDSTDLYRPLGVGGAVLNTNEAKIVILNSTISNNKAYYNAGLSNGAPSTFGYPVDNRMSAGSLFKIGNSIIAGNTIASYSLGGMLTLPRSGEAGVAFPVEHSSANCWAMDDRENKILSLLNNVFDSPDSDDCGHALKYSFDGAATHDSFQNPGVVPPVGLSGSCGASDSDILSTTCNLSVAPALSRSRDAYHTVTAVRWASYIPAPPFDQRGFVRIAGEADRGAREEGASVHYNGCTSSSETGCPPSGTDPEIFRQNRMLSYPGSAGLGVLFEMLPPPGTDVEPSGEPFLTLGGTFRTLNIRSTAGNRSELNDILVSFALRCGTAKPSECEHCQVSPMSGSARDRDLMPICSRYARVCEDLTTNECRSRYAAILGTPGSATPSPGGTPPAGMTPGGTPSTRASGSTFMSVIDTLGGFLGFSTHPILTVNITSPIIPTSGRITDPHIVLTAVTNNNATCTYIHGDSAPAPLNDTTTTHTLDLGTFTNGVHSLTVNCSDDRTSAHADTRFIVASDSSSPSSRVIRHAASTDGTPHTGPAGETDTRTQTLEDFEGLCTLSRTPADCERVGRCSDGGTAEACRAPLAAYRVLCGEDTAEACRRTLGLPARLDPSRVAAAIGNLQIPENLGGTHTPIPAAGNIQFENTTLDGEEGHSVLLKIKRMNGSAGAVSTTLTLVNGTAVAGTDFALPAPSSTCTANSCTLNWADGDVNDKQFEVGILQSSAAHPVKNMTLTLTGTAVGTPALATITIPAKALADHNDTPSPNPIPPPSPEDGKSGGCSLSLTTGAADFSLVTWLISGLALGLMRRRKS